MAVRGPVYGYGTTADDARNYYEPIYDNSTWPVWGTWSMPDTWAIEAKLDRIIELLERIANASEGGG